MGAGGINTVPDVGQTVLKIAPILTMWPRVTVFRLQVEAGGVTYYTLLHFSSLMKGLSIGVVVIIHCAFSIAIGRVVL